MNMRDENGQALFEFMVFIPVILIFTVLFMRSFAAVNSSVNQQKAVRGYLYYLVQGNSQGIRADEVYGDLIGRAKLSSIGNFGLGWDYKGGEEEDGSSTQQKFSPCFKFVPYGQKEGELCDEGAEEESSNFIKVHVYYALCSESYKAEDGAPIIDYDRPLNKSCLNF